MINIPFRIFPSCVKRLELLQMMFTSGDAENEMGIIYRSFVEIGQLWIWCWDSDIINVKVNNKGQVKIKSKNTSGFDVHNFLFFSLIRLITFSYLAVFTCNTSIPIKGKYKQKNKSHSCGRCEMANQKHDWFNLTNINKVKYTNFHFFFKWVHN